MVKTQKLQKMGQASLGMLIPKFFLDTLEWTEEDSFILSIEHDDVVIRKEKRS